MKRSRYSRTRDEGGEESVFVPKHKVIVNSGQWSYLRRYYRLTSRELQVGKLVCRGFSNREIGETLKMKQGTVKTHLLNIYRKAHVTSKMALLLTFANARSKSSAKRNASLPIAIVETESKRKKRPASSKIREKIKTMPQA